MEMFRIVYNRELHTGGGDGDDDGEPGEATTHERTKWSEATLTAFREGPIYPLIREAYVYLDSLTFKS